MASDVQERFLDPLGQTARAADPLGQTAAGGPDTALGPPPVPDEDLTGQKLGVRLLRRKVGEGGMGVRVEGFGSLSPEDRVGVEEAVAHDIRDLCEFQGEAGESIQKELGASVLSLGISAAILL